MLTQAQQRKTKAQNSVSTNTHQQFGPLTPSDEPGVAPPPPPTRKELNLSEPRRNEGERFSWNEISSVWFGGRMGQKKDGMKKRKEACYA